MGARLLVADGDPAMMEAVLDAVTVLSTEVVSDAVMLPVPVGEGVIEAVTVPSTEVVAEAVMLTEAVMLPASVGEEVIETVAVTVTLPLSAADGDTDGNKTSQ